MDQIAVRLVIRGCVQGVGYRWWARTEARRLGLGGWVRNRIDGSVELLVAGPAAAIEQFVAACRRGPTAASVASVEEFEAAQEDLTDFEERPTI
jgi:acylphosphatase